MNKDTNIVYWCDNLRALATIGVVVIHVTMNLVFLDVNSPYWGLGIFLNGLSRFSVPIFVLITGSFLLSPDKEIDTKTFLKKRMVRVLIPFVFWNFLYSIYQLKLYYGVLGNLFGWSDLFMQIKNYWFNGAALQFWYIYVLIGLYLFIPVINKWVRVAGHKDYLYFLSLWFISLFFFDTSSSLYSTVTPFAGFVGYLLLGNFLYRKNLSNQKYILPISVLLFISGLLIAIFGSLYLRKDSGSFMPLLFEDLAPNVVVMAVSVFVIAKYWTFFNQNFKLLRIISQYSFGIYLIHIFILWFLERFGISYQFINPYIGIPVTIVLCLVASISVLWVMAKIPLLNKVTGKV